MHPAPSVIVFTVLSGLGFGFLAFLGLGIADPEGWPAFWLWGLGYALAAGGLTASTAHLGNPQRALLAFTQWRTSWLSREAWTSVAALLLLAPCALGDWLGFDVPLLGLIGAALSALTIFCTSMLYAQLKTVPRWNHFSVPLTYGLFSLTGGAILAGTGWFALLCCLALGIALVWGFRAGDLRFAACGSTLSTATGLGSIGSPRVFEQPHTGGNYLMREMIHVVGRKHAQKLRVIAVLFAAVLPAPLTLWPSPLTIGLAVLLHLTGAFVQRWLFFAEAEHVVGLYYGKR